MRYNLKGTHVAITDEIRTYLDKKLSPHDKFLSSVEASRADIELQFDAMRDGPKYRVEITLHDAAHPNTFRTEAWGTTLHEAIDIVAGELFHALSRAKKKRQSRVRRGAAKFKSFLQGFGGWE